MRILLADDHLESVEALATCFVLAGFNVQVARDGSEALSIAVAWVPDIAISDIDMPRVDGYQLARSLRAHMKTQHIVLIAVTGRASKCEAQKALVAGFDHHIPKPAAPERLLALVSQQLSQRHGKQSDMLDERSSILTDAVAAENAVDN